jgi:hypothetical protein
VDEVRVCRTRSERRTLNVAITLHDGAVEVQRATVIRAGLLATAAMRLAGRIVSRRYAAANLCHLLDHLKQQPIYFLESAAY